MTLDVTHKCLRKNNNKKKGRDEMNEQNEIEVEYEIVKILAEKRWELQKKLVSVDEALAKNSKHFFVGEDGLINER